MSSTRSSASVSVREPFNLSVIALSFLFSRIYSLNLTNRSLYNFFSLFSNSSIFSLDRSPFKT